MLFNSLEFLIFFPLVVLIYFVLPKKIRQYWLLIASYYFYMCWNVKYVILLLFSTLVTYFSGLLLERAKNAPTDEAVKIKNKKWVVAGSFILNLAVLFYFKYYNFSIDSIQAVFSHLNIELNIPRHDLLLPVGISFYIFQALSYIMDVYRDEIYAERNFFKYALFVSFFPQLVAGPIERSKNLLTQLSQPKDPDYDSIRTGLLTMLWGFFIKLVIADRAAVLVNTVYEGLDIYSGLTLITANILFAVQIYGDFMGYSLIAIGAAKVMGYKLMDNFERPHFAQSIKEFWRRWHISLSSWLRDYLYIPLGGSRCSKSRKYMNIMITFLVSGLWHGASATYVLWGGLHGLYQIFEDILLPISNRINKIFGNDNKLLKCLRIVKTFILVDIAWVFFRAESVHSALHILKSSLDFSGSADFINGGALNLGLDMQNIIILLISIAILFAFSMLSERKINVFSWISSKNFVIRYSVYWILLILIIVSLDINGQEFIYFQF